MDVNDNACFLNKRAALESIASNRASTGCSYIGIGDVSPPFAVDCGDNSRLMPRKEDSDDRE
jgi:hypothetical protein